MTKHLDFSTRLEDLPKREASSSADHFEKPNTFKYYHYCSKEAGNDIIKCQEIRATIVDKEKKRDAHFGPGVYLTVIPPAPGQKKSILKNNWRNTKCFQKAEMFFEINISKEDRRIKTCDNPDGRFISLYSGTLDLDNYKWTYGVYEDSEIFPKAANDSEEPKKVEKIAKKIANHFFSQLAADFFPWYSVSAFFGVENMTGVEIPQNLSGRKIQDIVLGGWRSLYLSEDFHVPYITRENIAEALVSGNLGQKYQEWIDLLVTNGGGSLYTDELTKRGFESIHWVTLTEWMTTNTLTSTEPLEEFLKQNRCDVCSQIGARYRCKKCKKGHFCSKEHQKMYWIFHKMFCKNMD